MVISAQEDRTKLCNIFREKQLFSAPSPKKPWRITNISNTQTPIYKIYRRRYGQVPRTEKEEEKYLR
jgi:hypothetical protein